MRVTRIGHQIRQSPTRMVIVVVMILAVVVCVAMFMLGHVMDSLANSEGVRTIDESEFARSRELYGEVLRNNAVVHMAGAKPRFVITPPCADKESPFPAQSKLVIMVKAGLTDAELSDAFDQAGWVDGQQHSGSDDYGSQIRLSNGVARAKFGEGTIDVRRVDADDCVLR